MNAVTTPKVKDHDDDQRGHRSQQRAGQRLVQAQVDHLGRQRRVLSTNLTNPVKDDNGVVERISDDGQKGCNHRQVDLEVL